MPWDMAGNLFSFSLSLGQLLLSIHDTDMGIRNSNRFIENYLPLFLEKEDANE